MGPRFARYKNGALIIDAISWHELHKCFRPCCLCFFSPSGAQSWPFYSASLVFRLESMLQDSRGRLIICKTSASLVRVYIEGTDNDHTGGSWLNSKSLAWYA